MSGMDELAAFADMPRPGTRPTHDDLDAANELDGGYTLTPWETEFVRSLLDSPVWSKKQGDVFDTLKEKYQL